MSVVLAAGAGTRFGGVKQAARVGGRPVLGRVLGALAGIGDRGIVVLGAAADSVADLVPPGEWEVVVAAGWEAGPGASLRAGLAAAPEAGSALVTLGDLAWLGRGAAERVVAAARCAPREVEALRAVEGGEPGHPVLVRGGLLEAARSAPDEGLRPLLQGVEVAAVDCPGLGVCRDVDSPSDLGRGA